MNQGKHYYAFISHSSKDEKIALWLCDKLNGYHIPATVQKEYGVPKSIKPCFTFQTDLARDPVLKRSLEKELDDSQFLIVVCSPNSAKSSCVDGEVKHYVNDEVQHFINTGRSDKIIPFIIEGKPHAINPEEECFCPALLSLKGEAELKGVNLIDLKKRLGSKMAAVVNVIASMLGVRFDVLWDKFRRKRRRRNSMFGIASVLFLIFSLYIWQHKEPTFSYYADFVECNGIPQGVCPVDLKLLAEREVTYRFRYDYLSLFDRERVLSKVECINSFGKPRAFDHYHKNIQGLLKSYYPVLVLNYTKEKRVKTITLCNAKGIPQIEYLYSDINLKGGKAFVIDISQHNSNYDLGSFINIEERSGRSNVKRVLVKTDSCGFVQSITYHANNGNLKESLTTNNDGVYGYVFELDSLHRIVSVISVNEDKLRMDDIYGVNKTLFKYSSFSSIKTQSHFDKKDQPVNCSWNYFMSDHEFDSYGNIIKVTTFDENGEVCINKQGYAIECHKYEKGCPIESVIFDEKGKRMNSPVAKIWKAVRKYDVEGNCIEISYFDKEGDPAYNEDGYSRVLFRFSNGNCVEQQTFDICNKPVISKTKGDAKTEVRYNRQGQQIEGISYGVKGEKIINKYGYCSEKRTYGKLGEVSSWEIFDTQGNRICCGDGFSIMKAEVSTDEEGNQIVTFSFFDNHEKNTINNEVKSHKCVFILDSNGNIKEQQFYDIENCLSENKDGIAIAKYDYDTRGRITRVQTYDKEGLLFGGITDCPIFERVYPSDTTTITYYKDESNNLIESLSEAAIIKKVVSADTIISSFYDASGKACLCRDGYAISKEIIAKMTFDNKRRIKECYYFGVDGSPIKIFDSIAGFRENYDNRGNVIEYMFLDERRDLTNNVVGVAINENKYDDRDNLIETYCYDKEQNPCFISSRCHKIVMKYDERDCVIERSFFDVHDNLYVDPVEGFACQRTLYDIYGNEIENTFWDDCLEPATNTFNVHKIEFDYDGRNNCVCQKFYDEYDELTLCNGSAIIEQKWDDHNNITQRLYFDTDSILLCTESYEYNQYGFLWKTERQLTGTTKQKGINLPVVYLDPNNINETNHFVLLEWQKWNITRNVDFYLDALEKSRRGAKKKMVVMDNNGVVMEMLLDENVLLNLEPVLEHFYETSCRQYLQWKRLNN